MRSLLVIALGALGAAAAPAGGGDPRELLLAARAATQRGDAPRAAALYDAGLAALGLGVWVPPQAATAVSFRLGRDDSLRSSPHTPALLDEAADALGRVKQPGRAAALRAVSHGLWLGRHAQLRTRGDPAALAASLTALLAGTVAQAQDLQNDLRFDDALQLLDSTQSALRSDLAALPAPAKAVLLKLRAGLHSCAGRDGLALATFDAAQMLARGGAGASSAAPSVATRTAHGVTAEGAGASSSAAGGGSAARGPHGDETAGSAGHGGTSTSQRKSHRVARARSLADALARYGVSTDESASTGSAATTTAGSGDAVPPLAVKGPPGAPLSSLASVAGGGAASPASPDEWLVAFLLTQPALDAGYDVDAAEEGASDAEEGSSSGATATDDGTSGLSGAAVQRSRRAASARRVAAEAFPDASAEAYSDATAAHAEAYPDASERLLHLDLTRRAAAAARALAAAPPLRELAAAGASGASDAPGESARRRTWQLARAAASLHASLERRVDAALRQGPWQQRAQLPRHYTSGLASRAWHSVARDFPQLAPVERLLQEAAPALAGEWRALHAGGKTFPETECVHDAGRGSWWHYSVEGPWLVRDAAGCAVDAPVVCGLLARLRALALPGFRVLRSGYSAVGGRSHLRPHHGNTNAQLKMHLGLIVPAVGGGVYDAAAAAASPPAAPCARIRVGNETRAWVQGRVLFFDDSWEHEVWNDCPVERVVLQLVFVHPEAAVEAAVAPSGPAPSFGG